MLVVYGALLLAGVLGLLLVPIMAPLLDAVAIFPLDRGVGDGRPARSPRSRGAR